jgi:hypothetical protein
MTPKERKEIQGIVDQMKDLNKQAGEITGENLDGRSSAIRLAAINTAVRDLSYLLSRHSNRRLKGKPTPKV